MAEAQFKEPGVDSRSTKMPRNPGQALHKVHRGEEEFSWVNRKSGSERERTADERLKRRDAAVKIGSPYVEPG